MPAVLLARGMVIAFRSGSEVGARSERRSGSRATTLGRIRDVSTPPLASTAGRGTAQERRVRVLLVDDDRYFRSALTTLLELEGFAVRTAADGYEGLSRLLAHPPDVLILDLAMPRMTGEELLDRKTNHAAVASVPTLIVTAQPSPAAAELHPGVTLLRKPVSPERIVSALRSVHGVSRDLPPP